VTDYAAVPLDPESTTLLAGSGLDFRLLDLANQEAARRWLLAEMQGFHDPVPSDEFLAAQLADLGNDRITGVWDHAGAEPNSPVATVRSWAMDLTVPGGSTMPAWAISGVTVAPTHRRRGVARALLSAELRTARRAGLAMAMLTVSEATIYGRFGFGPAAYQAHYSIDTTRARWAGPATPGRVHLVEAASLLDDAPGVFERSRGSSPGEVDRRGHLWRRILGLYPLSEGEQKGEVRAVRYDDESGRVQGFAIYKFVHEANVYPGRLELADLVAATDDASAALWRYLLEMDLIHEIRAPLRSVSEPVSRQLSDYRAVRKTDERDHLWLRILDVRAVLEQRTYSAPGTFLLTVSDDLEFAAGEFLVAIQADGRATVSEASTSEAFPDAARLALPAADLAAVYLGGTSAVTLARAGRVTEQTTDAAARLDASFHSPHIPRLSTWF
jgi:predicted acetyltransferase